MKNIAPKLPIEEYEKNFAELHPPLTLNSAVAEANRCLYCYDSPCMKACPTHIDISTFIKKISTGRARITDYYDLATELQLSLKKVTFKRLPELEEIAPFQ